VMERRRRGRLRWRRRDVPTVAGLGDEEGHPGTEEGSSELAREGEEGREGQGKITDNEKLARSGMVRRRNP
jgi:hypothetical protein